MALERSGSISIVDYARLLRISSDYSVREVECGGRRLVGGADLARSEIGEDELDDRRAGSSGETAYERGVERQDLDAAEQELSNEIDERRES